MTNPICADGKQDMFPPTPWDAIAFSDSCYKNYGVRPRMQWAGIQFWAKNLQSLTNVIFR